MLRGLRIAFLIFFVLLAIALFWRAFFHEPIRIEDESESPPVATEAITPQQITEADLVLDLFNPSETALAGQLGDSARKRQIEEAMTISFILRRCKYIDSDEYSDTYRAIQTYAQRLQPDMPPAQVAADMQRIVESSSASYALIYSRVACDSPQLRTSARQLAKWRESLLNPAK